MPEWYESFFDALANDVWRALVPAEASEAESAFLVRQLCTPAQAARRLLDVPCGDGRLALRLAALGHHVVGVDLSEYALHRLGTDDLGHRVDARVGDMRDLGAVLSDAEVFDGAFCMGNSFGYLGRHDTKTFLNGLADRVRPGGRFVVDASTVAEIVLAHLGESDRYEAGGAALTNVHTYEVRTSTMVTNMTLELGDQRDERVARHRVMTCREIVDLVEGARFSVEDIDGGLEGEEFRVGAPRCLITARRI